MELRKALKELRSELKMSQSELAAALNINFTTVNRWETGKNSPNKSAAVSILNAAQNRGASTVCIESLKEALFPTNGKCGIDDLKYAEMDRINHLLNDSSNGVTVCDAETYELLYINRQAALIAGKDVSEAEGQCCYRFFMHRDTPCDICRMNMLSEDEFLKWDMLHPDGERHYMMRGKLISWNGKPAHIEYITDVTEHYATEQKLAESHEMLKRACNFADMWTFRYEVQNNIAYPDEKLQREFGMAAVVNNFPEEVFTWNIVLPEYFSVYREMVDKIKNGEKQSECIMRTSYKGMSHWLRFRMNTIEYDPEGKPLIAICSAQPVDKEKAMEMRRLDNHNRIVSASRNLLGFAISNISRNVIIDHSGINDKIPGTEQGEPYDSGIARMSGSIISDKDSRDFICVHNRERLLNRFTEGKMRETMEYQFLRDDIGPVWARNELYLYMDPVNGDIFLYEYSYDVRQDKMFAGLLSAAVNYNFDYLAAVSMSDGRMTVVDYFEEDKSTKLTTLSYGVSRQHVHDDRIITEDKEQFFLNTDLAYIEEQLKTKKIHSFKYRILSDNGAIKTKLGRFSWFDEDKRICLLTSMDIGELIGESEG